MSSVLQPILLKGHERPLTALKFNREGDLLVSCAKDLKPTVWYSDNGERLGTYNGHKGTVWDCDISFQSTRLLTGSSDRTAKLWDLKTGKELYSFEHQSSIRSVAFAQGEKMIMTVQDNQYQAQPTIFIYNIENSIEEQTSVPIRSMVPSKEGSGKDAKINTALWGSLNQTVISAGEDGVIRLWDVDKGVEIQKVVEHKKAINSMQFSKDHTMFITASADHTAKLFDTKTLGLLKTFQSDRPLNASAVSPLTINHVIVGGGQEASSAALTDRRAGKFEVDFFHLVYMDFLGSVKGHFGPVNALAFSPDGKSYASGSEDGYIRLHHFPKDYFNPKYNY